MEINKKRSRSVYRIFWGVLFLLAGAAVLLNLTGVLPVPHGMDAGNIIWSIILALVTIWSIIHRFWFITFYMILGIVYVWRDQLGLHDMNFWPLAGAALLLSIGFSILFKNKHKSWRDSVYVGTFNYKEEDEDFHKKVSEAKDASAGDESAARQSGGVHSSSAEDENNVYIKASFGSTIKYVNARALTRAYVDCSFGSVKAFFDNATVADGGAVIEIDNSFGGMELYIPREWRLIDDINRTFGGVDIKNPEHERSGGPVVRLTGNVNFGGVEIILV
jgi:predicted membrane protein